MESNKTYFLDLRTLLTYLQNISCSLTTRLDDKGRKGTGYIVLQAGKIVRSWIEFQDGRVLEGPQALEQLYTRNQWQVQLGQKTELPPSIQMSPSPSDPAVLPANNQPPRSPPLRQKALLSPLQLKHLPAQQRLILGTILTMIDGTRTAADIKAQLNLSPETVDRALAWLRSLNVIE